MPKSYPPGEVTAVYFVLVSKEGDNSPPGTTTDEGGNGGELCAPCMAVGG